jgi:hypothetical protein
MMAKLRHAVEKKIDQEKEKIDAKNDKKGLRKKRKTVPSIGN